MINNYQSFLQLHQQEQPLLIGNAWDLTSALAFERMGFKAIATSSVAVANSMGYEDKEQIPFELLLSVVKRMITPLNVPLSVDLETGYSRTIPGIIENIEKLYDLGVVGINIEDSLITERGKLLPITDFVKIISSIRNHLDKKNMQMFINARTDGFLAKQPSSLDETIKRAIAYEEAGASGLFVIFLDDEYNTRQIVQATKLPLNIFCTRSLPSFDIVKDWGVKRISMGGSIYKNVIMNLDKTLGRIQEEGSFESLFG